MILIAPMFVPGASFFEGGLGTITPKEKVKRKKKEKKKKRRKKKERKEGNYE